MACLNAPERITWVKDEGLVHLKDAGKRNAALLAIGGPPHEVRVCLDHAEEVHLGLPQPPMLQQVSTL